MLWQHNLKNCKNNKQLNNKINSDAEDIVRTRKTCEMKNIIHKNSIQESKKKKSYQRKGKKTHIKEANKKNETQKRR